MRIMAKEPNVIENNGLDAPDNDPNDAGVLWESRVVALQEERAAYEKRGLTDRVAAVDAELERLGYRGGKKVGNTRDEAVTVTETARALPKDDK